jgi:peptide/nickel transport system substrate-binding protein
VIIAERHPEFRRPLLGALLVALGLWTLGCAKTPEPEWPAANVLVLTLNNAPTNLDTRLGTDAASQRTFELMYHGLVSKDTAGNLTPGLAQSWEVLDGGRRYRFHLRPGVKFHDGSTLDAEDVKWTYGTIVDGTVSTPKSAAYDRVEEIEILDPLTVDFHLSEPFGSFLVEFTSAQGVMPAGSTPEQMNVHPVGTGCFEFVAKTPETVTLTRYEDCWEGVPYIERIVLREVPDATVRVLELMKGTVQLLINDVPPDLVPRFREHASYRVAEDPGAVYAYIGLNLRDPLLEDVQVRRALAHAIDRQKIVDTLWNGLGVVSETMLPPGLYYRNEELEVYEFDPELAGRLLDEAGYPDPDGDGPRPRFELSYKTSTNEPYVLQAQVIQQMLAEVGIDMEIRSQEFATFYDDIQKGNFQLFGLLRFGVTDPNIYDMTLHSKNFPPEGQNRGFYQNAEFDRLVDQAAALTEPAERKPLYLRIQEIFYEDLPYISLYTRVNVAVMPELLKGYVNYPNGELYGLKDVYWDRDGQRPADQGLPAPEDRVRETAPEIEGDESIDGEGMPGEGEEMAERRHAPAGG